MLYAARHSTNACQFSYRPGRPSGVVNLVVRLQIAGAQRRGDVEAAELGERVRDPVEAARVRDGAEHPRAEEEGAAARSIEAAAIFAEVVEDGPQPVGQIEVFGVADHIETRLGGRLILQRF